MSSEQRTSHRNRSLEFAWLTTVRGDAVEIPARRHGGTATCRRRLKIDRWGQVVSARRGQISSAADTTDRITQNLAIASSSRGGDTDNEFERLVSTWVWFC